MFCDAGPVALCTLAITIIHYTYHWQYIVIQRVNSYFDKRLLFSLLVGYIKFSSANDSMHMHELSFAYK